MRTRAMRRVEARYRWDRLRVSFWFAPAIMALAAVLLAWVMYWLDAHIPNELLDSSLLVLAGTFFPVDLLPEALLRIAYLDPVFHMNQGTPCASRSSIPRGRRFREERISLTTAQASGSSAAAGRLGSSRKSRAAMRVPPRPSVA